MGLLATAADTWLNKARFAHSLTPAEPQPAWSIGELLADTLILHDTEQLTAMQCIRDEPLERLRHDVGLPTVAAAVAVFDSLFRQVAVTGVDR